MDSGTSGGSMQSGSSGEDDQNDTSSFPAGVASVPRLHQHLYLPQTHLRQPIYSSQHLHYPPLASTRSDDNNMSGYNPSPHLSSNTSFLETPPQSDLDRIWSMSMNNTHPQTYQHRQQQISYPSTSSLAPSSSAMNPDPQTTQDAQPKPPGKIPSLEPQPGKENGSSPGRAVKKRTRASRKTPTTVLTTDTTNFRAMVQEFTGIPTPPFGPSSLFPAKKFDIFGSNSNRLDHPSLGSLLFSLNKSTNNNPNPNHNPDPFAPPLITTASQIHPFARERNQSTNPNPYQQQQQSQQMMLPQGSNSAYINLPQGDQIRNPNMAFHQSSGIDQQRLPYQSKYSNSGNEADQLGGFLNVEREENNNISRRG